MRIDVLYETIRNSLGGYKCSIDANLLRLFPIDVIHYIDHIKCYHQYSEHGSIFLTV